jgi:hypothetical protein
MLINQARQSASFSQRATAPSPSTSTRGPHRLLPLRSLAAIVISFIYVPNSATASLAGCEILFDWNVPRFRGCLFWRKQLLPSSPSPQRRGLFLQVFCRPLQITSFAMVASFPGFPCPFAMLTSCVEHLRSLLPILTRTLDLHVKNCRCRHPC